MTEAQLQLAAEQLLEACRVRGLLVDYYHRPDRAAGRRERAGLPDLVIALGPGRVAAVELKSEKGKTTAAQDRWLAAFPLASVCRSLPEFRHALAGFGVDTTGISERDPLVRGGRPGRSVAAMTPLQTLVLGVVRASGPDGISLDELAGEVCYRSERSPSASRATARDVLRRLGAEGLVESVDAGKSWRATT